MAVYSDKIHKINSLNVFSCIFPLHFRNSQTSWGQEEQTKHSSKLFIGNFFLVKKA